MSSLKRVQQKIARLKRANFMLGRALTPYAKLELDLDKVGCHSENVPKEECHVCKPIIEARRALREDFIVQEGVDISRVDKASLWSASARTKRAQGEKRKYSKRIAPISDRRTRKFWTPERRAAHSRKIKKAWAERRAPQ